MKLDIIKIIKMQFIGIVEWTVETSNLTVKLLLFIEILS